MAENAKNEMTDRTRENENEKADDRGDNNDKDDQQQESSLERFIVDHYEQQTSEGRHDPTDDIDEEKTANFFSRAIGESRRMCREVEMSQRKLERLHTELGAGTFTAWRNEHAAEVLLPEEAEKIALAEQIYAQH